MRRTLPLLAAIACSEPDSRPPPRDAGPVDTGTVVEPTVPVTPPGTTPPVTTPIAPDCSVPPPPGPFEWSRVPLETEEDFDFDQAGFLITQRGADLLGLKRDGTFQLVATGVGFDASGIRSLVTGNIVVAQPDSGTLRFVTYGTGGSSTILADLNFPNGVEASIDGSVYSSEHVPDGEVRHLDPDTGVATVLATVEWPNNLALSPDERTLYVVSSTGLLLGHSSILSLDRDDTGAWGPDVRLFRDYERMLGGITTDACGNVYVVEYSGGVVVRLDPEDASGEVVGELPAGGPYSSLRFAPGIGEFARTELFVTARYEMYVADVGIEGRHVLVGWP